MKRTSLLGLLKVVLTLSILSSGFIVCAQPGDGAALSPPSASSIVIDGWGSDWAGIDPIVIDPPGDCPTVDIFNVYVTDDGTYLYFMMERGFAPQGFNYFELDVDQDIGTGYDTDTDVMGWYSNPHGTGIDYWIEVFTIFPGVAMGTLVEIYPDGNKVVIKDLEAAAWEVIETRVLLGDIGEPALPAMNMHFSTIYSSYVREDEAPDVGHVIYSSESISVYTDKYSYGVGDTMYIGLDIMNPGVERPCCLALWVEPPGGGARLFMHKHDIALPSGIEYSDPAFKTLVLPAIPEGAYTWFAALLDPSTHDKIVEDTAEWEYT